MMATGAGRYSRGMSITFPTALAPVLPLASAPRVAAPRWPVPILGVPLDPLTIDEALARIGEMVASGEPHYVVTPNVDILVQGRRNPELHRILCEADLVLCDGQPLVWASRLLGNALPERVAGSDLTPRLIAQAERKGHRIFLLGASPEANARAVERLRKRHPRLEIAGHFSPPFRPLDQMDHDEIVCRVRAAEPDILFVSFGCPKQEQWIAMHYRALGVPVCLGVGATIDFLAGRVRRAPPWMRRWGLEWSYRLLQEPRRLFRRYLTDFLCFGPDLLAQGWAHLRGNWHDRGAVETVSTNPQCLELRATGTLDRGLLEQPGNAWAPLSEARCDCRLDVDGVNFIDDYAAAALTVWHRRLRRAGHRLVLVASAERALRALRQACLEHLEIQRPQPGLIS
jgi:N-acetylglucosaminyldiphosphoundecaprenol N-acetyl-beta-D-mannosaminyltransferase